MITNKYIKISFLGSLMTVMGFISQAQNITIAGKMHLGKYENLALTDLEQNVNIPVQLTKQFTFQVTVPVLKKGFYKLGSLTLYLEPGFDLQVKPADNTYTFSGRGERENNALIRTNDAKAKYLHLDPSSGGFYFSTVNISTDSLLRMMDRYRAVVNANAETTTNPYFKNLFIAGENSYCRIMFGDFKKNYGLDSLMLGKLQGLGTSTYYTDPIDRGMLVMSIAYYGLYQNWLTDAEKAMLDLRISKGFDWNNEALYLNSVFYRRELSDKIGQINALKGKAKPQTDPQLYADQMRIVDENVNNPVIKNRLKGAFGLGFLKIAKDGYRVDSMYKVLTSLKLPNYLRDMIAKQYKNNKVLSTDPTSINFAYPDIQGKIVQLKDLRGKYVYIDVWATWCAPCKAEIPFLMNMEEAYKGKNIAFVSLSVDKQSDKGTWQQMVKDMKLGGIQVMADKDFSSEFVQIFQIASIPRFILIAPDGKIVSPDALRPSDPKLKDQMDKLLN